MAVKRGLGRGLGALLGDPTPVSSEAPARGLVHVPVGAIAPNPNQPRTTFAAGPLDELRASIAEFGVLVPIIVRKLRDDRYELIAGERRWRAAAAAGLETIPALVRDADARESLEVAIIENLQRENLNALEEAMGFAHLMETYNFTQERVAERVGRSRPTVGNALRLLDLSDEIKALVHTGRLSGSHARALLALPEARRMTIAKRVIAEGLSVRAVEALAQPSVPRTRRQAVGTDPRTSELVERLRYRLATRVGVTRTERGGSIEIRFADDDELLRIADLLLGDAPG